MKKSIAKPTWLSKTGDLFDTCFPYCISMILILAFLGIAVIALNSADTLHPDEQQTKPAILYYTNHNLPPDVRELDSSYFSGYGMTRLGELNLYYFFAGKLAAIFSIPFNFRLLNILLAFILTVIGIKNVRKNLPLALVFCLTPQLWYLFSYSTSDAFDFFLSALCLEQLLQKDSFLNQALHKKFQELSWFHFLLPGILFGFLLMSKKNFYLIPLWLFFCLLYQILSAPKEERRKLLCRCLILLGIAFFIFFLRVCMDLPVYGFEKSQIVDQVIEQNSLYEYKPSTPARERAPSVTLMEKGTSLITTLTKMNFHKLLLESFCGLYGCYSVGTNSLYYWIYGILLASLLCFIGFYIWNKGNRFQKLTYFTCVFCELLSYLLVIYNAYVIDFQPQGRYLFPALIVAIYTSSICPELKDSRYFSVLVLGLSTLSLLSFWLVAIPGLL